MRCNICDRALSEQEIVHNKDLNAYEPCSVCLAAAFEAAYSDGFCKESTPEGEAGGVLSDFQEQVEIAEEIVPELIEEEGAKL